MLLFLLFLFFFFFNDTATTEIYTLSLHDALPIWFLCHTDHRNGNGSALDGLRTCSTWDRGRSEEHTSELQSRLHLVCRLLLEKKKKQTITMTQDCTVTLSCATLATVSIL